VRLRFALAGLVVGTALLAACSSGTSCGFGCPPVNTPTPTPSLSLAGTQTQAFKYYYGNPTVQPPVTITTTIAQTVTVAPTSLASPFPGGTANDVHISEKDVIDGLQEIDSTSDSYTANSGSNVLLYGSVENTDASSNGQASAIQLVYAAPQIVDKTPETGGATWTNQPGAQLGETYSDGHVENRTIANDGTYAETGTAQSVFGTGYIQTSLTELASAAGTYFGPFYNNPYYPSTRFTWSIGPPSAGKVTIAYKIYGQLPVTPYVTLPQWFPAKPVFFTESDSIRSGVTPPPACGASGTANDVVQTIERLDTVIGYTESQRRDTYTQSGAAVCVAFSDTLNNYYDWNGDTVHSVDVSLNKKKLSQVLTTEILSSATAPSVGANALHRSHGLRGASVIPMAAVAALAERFNAKIEATKRAILTSKKRGVR
jgi:hypothetical protein